ncbi:MAG: hypothetical protein ACR2NN_05680 [Bryobacteraceae bacterium]
MILNAQREVEILHRLLGGYVALPPGRLEPRAREKQIIRKQLHQQLRVLWQDHPALRFRLEPKPPNAESEADRIGSLAELGGFEPDPDDWLPKAMPRTSTT